MLRQIKAPSVRLSSNRCSLPNNKCKDKCRSRKGRNKADRPLHKTKCKCFLRKVYSKADRTKFKCRCLLPSKGTSTSNRCLNKVYSKVFPRIQKIRCNPSNRKRSRKEISILRWDKQICKLSNLQPNPCKSSLEPLRCSNLLLYRQRVAAS